MNGRTPPASPRPPASTARPRSAASAINRLQEAFEGTRDRESYLAERVAAGVGGVPELVERFEGAGLGNVCVYLEKTGSESELTAVCLRRARIAKMVPAFPGSPDDKPSWRGWPDLPPGRAIPTLLRARRAPL